MLPRSRKMFIPPDSK